MKRVTPNIESGVVLCPGLNVTGITTLTETYCANITSTVVPVFGPMQVATFANLFVLFFSEMRILWRGRSYCGVL